MDNQDLYLIIGELYVQNRYLQSELEKTIEEKEKLELRAEVKSPEQEEGQ